MGGLDMMIATRCTVEIEASPVRMLGLAALGLLMTALSTAVAPRAFPNVRAGSFVEFCGTAGAVFFAVCTMLLLWRAFTTHGAVVTITPEGIRDGRVAAELIAWSAVNGIAVW
jgi:hypothetical protein